MDIEERMRLAEKDLAVNTQISKTHRIEINLIFDMFREHMTKEEEQRDEMIVLISNINVKLNNQRSFIAGITFTVSIFWVIGIAAWHYFTK